MNEIEMVKNTKPRIYHIAMVQISELIGNNVILPLAIGMLWSQVSRRGDLANKWHLSKIVHLDTDLAADAQDLARCDIICFSTYTWNADHHINLAQQIKQINPRCYIVAGGPHFNERQHDFWQKFQGIFDIVILGDGEEAFCDLLEAFPDEHHISMIPGAWTPHIRQPSRTNRVKNTATLASPFLDGFYEHIVAQTHADGHVLQAILQTNRGCPYHCTFCEKGADYFNKLFTINLDTVFSEIEWCGRNQVEYLMLADDNFGILSRDIEIMEKICQVHLKYGYPKILDATWAKNNPENIMAMICIDKKHNTNLIRSITIALQSDNQPTLDAIKRFNLDQDKQNNFLMFLQDQNIPRYSELIWPLPFETYDSLCIGFDKTISRGLDNWVSMYPLQMLPSNNLYHDFGKNYVFASVEQEHTNKRNRAYINNFTPVASDWADHNAVVKGHVFYMWLTGLYFFGFARHALNIIARDLSWSLSQSINHFMDDLQTGHCAVSQQHKRIEKFYHDWLWHRDLDDLLVFRDKDTNFWYPFTHHASWLQINHELFLIKLTSWLEKIGLPNVSNIVDICRHSIVKFEQTYPMRKLNFQVELNHKPSRFSNLHEFCRYYYWWNRKKGYSRTNVSVS